VPRVGVTGHTNLSVATVPLVVAAIRAELEPMRAGLTGVTCLARGADQLFARIVVELGGRLEVVLPAPDYRARKVSADNLAEFDALLAAASAVHTMAFERSGGPSYQAASEHMLSTVDLLVAVWDGRPAAGHGGTADAVAAARATGVAVTVIWPEGAARD
jgi:hypothetical protein